MSFTYNFEEAKPKMLTAREILEERIAKWKGPYQDNIREMATMVNAPTFTSMCEKACANLDAMAKLFEQLLGQEGDEATDANVHGGLKYIDRGMTELGLN